MLWHLVARLQEGRETTFVRSRERGRVHQEWLRGITIARKERGRGGDDSSKKKESSSHNDRRKSSARKKDKSEPPRRREGGERGGGHVVKGTTERGESPGMVEAPRSKVDQHPR